MPCGLRTRRGKRPAASPRRTPPRGSTGSSPPSSRDQGPSRRGDPPVSYRPDWRRHRGSGFPVRRGRYGGWRVIGWGRRSDRVRLLGAVLVLMVAATVLRSAAARADTLFSDGFESGNLNLWTGKSGLVVQQQEVYAGAWAARGTTTGAAAYAYKSLSPTQSELYTDFRFKVVSQGNVNVALVRFRTSTGGAIVTIMRRNDGKLHYYNEITGAGIPSATVITTGVWHELKVHGLINGTAGLMEVWLDGVRLNDVSRTDNLGTNPIGRVYLGDPGTGKTWDIAFDEVVVSTSADVTPPTVPTGLTATAIGAYRVDLSWTASTDDTGVTGYTIYRGGAVLTTVGA